MRRAFLIGIGALLALMPAPGAIGAVDRAGGFSYVTKNYDLKPGKARTLEAPCPRRTNAVGGGSYNPHPFSSVFQYHSYPDDDGDRGRKPEDGWAVKVQAFTNKRMISVFAVCARFKPEYRSYKSSYDPDRSAGHAVGCNPSSLELVGGGTNGPRTLPAFESRPMSIEGRRLWGGTFKNTSQRTQTATVFSICAGHAVSFVGASGSVPPNSQALARATCPAEAPHVMSGGYGTPRATGRAAASKPDGFTGPEADSWTSWIDNLSSDDVAVTSWALCSPAV